MTWEETAKAKREAVLSQVPSEWIIKVPEDECLNTREYLDSVLPAEENAITSQSLISLCDKISAGKLTSLAVTTAFCHRAALSHQILNNCAEIFFDRALARAKELDKIYEQTGKTVGKLHGVPISLKDQINLPGLDSAIGLISRLNKPKTEQDESLIAQILYNEGAVFYIKTTTPMAMMATDTFSNIYGETLNAYNKKMSAGGSSGGEGSIIGSKAGLIGLSTDIGGSIRVPAQFQGLFAIRPSSNRLPYLKVENSMTFQPIVPSVIGPSAQYLEDIKFFVKLILDAEPWLRDPKVPPIPWRPYTLPKKLTIGIYKDNKATHPHPPIARAIDLIKAKLVEAGHEVVEFDPPIDAITVRDNLNKIFTSDGYKEIIEETAKTGEPVIPQLLSANNLGVGEVTVSEHWNQAKEKYETQLKFDEYWRSIKTESGQEVDAFISPGWESASHIAGDPQSHSSAYTYLSNYLDLTTGIIPITFVDETIDLPYKDFKPYSEDDKIINDTYDAKFFNGMPVTVQLIGKRYEEEKVLEMCGEIYKITH